MESNIVGTITVSTTGAYTTLQAAEMAAKAGGDHLIVVDAGTYSGNLELNSADNGLTILASAGAIDTGTVTVTGASNINIDGMTFNGSGGSTVAVDALNSSSVNLASDTFNNVGQAIKYDETSNSTVSGSTVTNATGAAIELDNGANSDTVSNTLINGDLAAETTGALFAHGTNNLTLTHNQIENTAGSGISLADFYAPGTTATENQNSVISYNVLNNTDTAGTDSGAIYIEGRSQVDSGDVVTSNYVNGGGAEGEHALGLYLDDNASGVTVTNNVFALGTNYSDAFEIHGGSDNTISHNVFDLGTSSSTSFGVLQEDELDQQPQGAFTSLTNDVVSDNIYTSESTSPRDPGFANETGGAGSGVTINGNDYWDYTKAALAVTGIGANGDSKASYIAPALAAATTLAAFGAYANSSFTAIDTSDIGLTTGVSATTSATTTSTTSTPTATTTTVATTSTASATVTIGSGSGVLVLNMSEDAYQGDAQFTVAVDGTQIGGIQTTTALHSSGSSQMFDVLGNFSNGSHTVSVNFLNDAYGGSASTDRNLYVNSATINGGAVSDSSLNLDSQGAQSFNFLETRAATPTPVGTTSTAPATITIGSGSGVLVLNMSEDAYQGDAQFTVTVDGTQIGGIQTTTALHSSGSSQTFDVLGNFSNGGHTVSVDFLNDAYGGSASTDRNLYVNSATIEGSAVFDSSLNLDSQGAQSFNFLETKAATPAPVGTTSTAPATITIGSGSGVLVLNMSEDAYQGDAQFTVAVDGTQIGGIQTTTATHSSGSSQTFDVLGNFSNGSHTVSVDFLNDAYGGSASTDRNLYVNSATIDGSAVTGSSRNLDSQGSQSFSFVEIKAATTTTVATSPATSATTTTVTVGSTTPVTATQVGNGTITVSLDGPYFTLAAGEAAAKSGGDHNIVVDAGTYSGNLALTSADNGLTITANAGVIDTGTVTITGASNITIEGMTFNGSGGSTIAVDALNSASVNVASDSFNNVGQAIKYDGTTNSTVSGNTVNNATGAAFEFDNGADNNTVYNNLINGDQVSETAGAIYAHGANSLTIDHNQIENIAGAAISLSDFYAPGTTATENQNAVISDNIIQNADTKGTDSGAIYILGRSQAETGDTVSMNFISGGGSAGEHAVGLYLDDNASGVTATDNIFNLGSNYSDAFEIHGGNSNILSSNVFDLGTSSTTSFGLFQLSEPDQQPQGSFTSLTNDVVKGNIYTTESLTPRNPGFANETNSSGSGVTITGNDYWAYTSAPLNVGGTGAGGDSNAVYSPPAAKVATTLSQFGSYAGTGFGFAPIDVSHIGPVV